MAVATRAIIVFSVLLSAIGCGKKAVRDEPYLPPAEIIRIKSDQKIVKVWNRWNETSNQDFLVGGKVVPMQAIENVLYNDPLSTVADKMDERRKWQICTATSAALTTVLWIVGIDYYNKKESSERDYGKGNQYYAAGTIPLGAALYCENRSQKAFMEALSEHNGRLNAGSRSPFFHIAWEFE